MGGLVDHVFGLARLYIVVGLIVLFFANMTSNNTINEVRDGKVELHTQMITKKFTPAYINSNAYWVDRTKWYKYGCRLDRDNCGDNTRFSHKQYINARYNNYYKRVDHLASGDKSFFWDLFSIR